MVVVCWVRFFGAGTYNYLPSGLGALWARLVSISKGLRTEFRLFEEEPVPKRSDDFAFFGPLEPVRTSGVAWLFAAFELAFVFVLVLELELFAPQTLNAELLAAGVSGESAGDLALFPQPTSVRKKRMVLYTFKCCRSCSLRLLWCRISEVRRRSKCVLWSVFFCIIILHPGIGIMLMSILCNLGT